MNAEKLIELYNRVAEAPDAIPRLRRFVLDLAVRGKLVEQDPGDEPAHELVKRIAELKSALANSGTAVRSSKSLTVVDEPPFELPRSWHWAPVRSVTRDHGQMVPRSAFTYIDVTAIDKEAGIVAEPRVLEAVEAPSRARRITEKGDVIYSCVRPYLLNVAVIEQDFNPPAIASTAFAVLDGLGMLLPRYLWIALRSPYMVSAVENCQRGQAYPAINDSDFAALPLPVPPHAEQHRIVARVDELMALLDRLEAVRGAREANRDRFSTASLTRLTAPDPDTRTADSQSTLDALPALTTRADQIKQLRQTILNLAATGALADQRATDGSAIDLLKELAEGQIQGRTRKKGAVRDPSALSGPLPASWVKVALGEVCELVTSGSRGWAEHYSTSGPAFIRAQNIRFGRLRLEDLACVSPPASAEGTRTRVSPGDLLIVITGAGVTNPALLDIDLGEAYVSQHVGLMRPSDTRLSRWMLLCLMADTGGREELVARAYGAGKPGLNLENLRSLSIPLPPLAEQHRIVAKVDELMALCDRLEAALSTADTTRARLLEALLHEALAPGSMAQEAA